MLEGRSVKFWLAAVFLAALIAGYNDCGQVQFSPMAGLNQNNGNNDPNGLPGNPDNAPTNVCIPFGGGSQGTSGSGASGGGTGLVAHGVYYVETSQLSAGETPLQAINNSVEGFFAPSAPNIGFANVNVLLQSIDFPAMYFTDGFVDSDGNALKDSAGNTLVQYFGLRIQGSFVPATWAPGDYQIAVLSDDGAILTMSGGQASGSDFVINNDGPHSMKMGCTSQVLHVTANSQIPLTFDYFQGPPVTIGLMLLYRPVTVVGNAQDPLCGQGGSSDSYFFLDHDSNNNPLNPSIPQAPYKQLTGPFNAATGSGGWQVIEAAHYEQPPGLTSSCNQ
jgi:hypothetical protein